MEIIAWPQNHLFGCQNQPSTLGQGLQGFIRTDGHYRGLHRKVIILGNSS